VESFCSVTHELRSKYLTISETSEQLKRILAPYRIRRIICVPYYREDFVHAVIAQQETRAPLLTYLMDDQNILTPLVPDRRVADLLAASKLVLGISPEICAAYSHKYGRPVHLLPPVLTSATDVVPCYWDPASGEPLRCAMIGNVWTAQGFGQLRELLRTNGLYLDWFGNGPHAGWLQGTWEEWEKDNIRCLGFLPEEDLVANLAAYPFVQQDYALLPHGASIGSGYGPVVVAREPLSVDDLEGVEIVFPGALTTAFLTLRLAVGEVATRDFLRSELRNVVEELNDDEEEDSPDEAS
jgi:hypothetical protein